MPNKALVLTAPAARQHTAMTFGGRDIYPAVESCTTADQGVAGLYKPHKTEQPGRPQTGVAGLSSGAYFLLFFGAPSSRGVGGRRPACSLASRSL